MFIRCLNAIRLLFLLALSGVTPSSHGQWGDISGRLVFDGEPPLQRRLDTQGRNGIENVLDQSLIVNQKNRGIGNVIVWLRPKRGEPLDVHPSFERTAQHRVLLEMKNGVFRPHVLLLRTSQTMVHKGGDNGSYNPIMDVMANAPM